MKRENLENSQNTEIPKPIQKPQKRPNLQTTTKTHPPLTTTTKQPQNNDQQKIPPTSSTKNPHTTTKVPQKNPPTSSTKNPHTTTTKVPQNNDQQKIPPTSSAKNPHTTTTKVPQKNHPTSSAKNPPKKNIFEDVLENMEERPTTSVPPPGIGGHSSRVLQRIKLHFPEVYEKLVVVATEIRSNDLKKILEETTKIGLDEFVGTTVSIFSRRHFQVVQKMDYFVCDRGICGMDFFLFICEEGVFIIDKKFFFYTLECTGFDVFSTKKGETTLLEGEFIRDKKTGRTVYYITDAIQVNGQHCASSTFTDRLNLIINVLGAQTRVKSTPFEFNKKRFYPKNHLPQLLHENLKYNQPNRGWYYQDEKRHHRVGGLLFKPNDPDERKHTFGRKFQNSVYFSTTKKAHDFRALCVATEYGETEFRQVRFPEQDEKRLVEDFGKNGISDFGKNGNFGNSGNSGNPIIECFYDCIKAEWRYIGLKPLRQRPSKVRDVLETMTIMAEGVTEKELSYRVPKKSSSEDDWMINHAKSW